MTVLPGNRRQPRRDRGLCHPVIPGCAEQDQRAGAAGTAFAHRRTRPGVTAAPTVANDQPTVTAVTAVTADTRSGGSGAATTPVLTISPPAPP